ncbi:hypothetical protein VTN77DRAFT_6021 [Rasamsonia byssochlamydoides]|uniref:uncharacterized protein n=1 Tax=Rasamsonia byssochlamydoides TaxID=89139 RepID=UPI0037441DB2
MARLLTLISLAAGVFSLTANAASLPEGIRQIEVDTTSVTVAEADGSSVIIIATNEGGSAQNKYWNEPVMATGMVHQVTVGGPAGLVYTPDTITANVGDMVQFNFMSANHTATQSSFDTPCKKLEGGVDSGFMPNPNNSLNPPPMMLFQVNTTQPIWMYCRQTGHCGKGMVFSINPTATKTQAAFKAAAIAQNGTASSSSSSSAAGSASSAAAAAPAASSAAMSSSSYGSSSGASVVQGSGTTSDGGVCSCSCLCGAAAFPAGAGIGAVGGWGGEISMVSAKKRSLIDGPSH